MKPEGVKPSPPLAYYQSPPSLNLSSLEQTMVQNEKERNHAFEVSREIQRSLVRVRGALETTDGQNESGYGEFLAIAGEELIPSKATRQVRIANLSNVVQDFCRLASFRHFLDTGHLIPPSSCPFATNEEYLGGACMGLMFDLQRYGLGRATVRDSTSVQMARNLSFDIQQQLLQFDFRNGPLRRKYDGTKYALQSLETLLYELSITSSKEESQDAKRLRTEKESSLIPTEELEKLRQEMVEYDEQREALIKRCRDGQKAAKQSIFALHRGNLKQAGSLLKTCETCITELMVTVQKEPSLRSGSFSNVLEEYVEGKLFFTWLYGSKGTEKKEDGGPVGTLLSPEDFKAMELQPDEFLGGLADLTGEVTRFAVQRGTVRDTPSVRKCLETVGAISLAFQSLPRLSGGMSKKADQVKRSVDKLERMLYMASLSEATGGRSVPSSVPDGNQEGVLLMET